MSSRFAWLTFKVAWFLATPFPLTALRGAPADDVPTMEQIEAAWAKRVEDVTTVKLVFSERRSSLQMAASPSPLRGKPEMVTKRIPRQVFYGRHGKLRYESVLIGATSSSEHLAVSDGEYTRSIDQEKNANGFYQGIIWDSRSLDGGGMIVEPVVMLYLPEAWREIWDQDIARMTIRAANVPREDREYVLLQGPGYKRLRTTELLVDPEHEFLPIELVQKRDGRITHKTVVRYDHATGRPKQWQASLFNSDGSVMHDFRVTVLDLDLKAPADPGLFRLEFPVGTFIDDKRTGKDYIQRPGGKLREVTPAEMARRPRYEDLLRTESGQAGLSPPRQWISSWWLWGIAAVLLIAAGWIYRSRYAS